MTPDDDIGRVPHKRNTEYGANCPRPLLSVKSTLYLPVACALSTFLTNWRSSIKKARTILRGAIKD